MSLLDFLNKKKSYHQRLNPGGETAASYDELYSSFLQNINNLSAATKIQEAGPHNLDQLRVAVIDQQMKFAEWKIFGLGHETNKNNKRNSRIHVVHKSQSNKGDKEIICYNCQERGHKKPEYPNLKKTDSNKKSDNNESNKKAQRQKEKGKFKKNHQRTKQISSLDNINNFNDADNFYSNEDEDQGF